MSAISFSMLGSSGALQSQVSEFQPAREQLQTEYFMFGYQFDPSYWVALNPRTGPYNPMNDLLNPLSVDSNELLQRQSIEYIEEQLIKQRWNDLKEKELFLKLVPEKLRKTVGDLYDRGIFRASLTPGEMDKTIDSLIAQGSLGSYDAGRLRALIAQRATFSQLTSQRASENSNAELEAIIQTVQRAVEAQGVSPQNTRQISRKAVEEALELGVEEGLNPNVLTNLAFERARELLKAREDEEAEPSIGGRPRDLDEYVGEEEITDSQALAEAGVGLGSRLSSAPTLRGTSEDFGAGAMRPSYAQTLLKSTSPTLSRSTNPSSPTLSVGSRAQLIAERELDIARRAVGIRAPLEEDPSLLIREVRKGAKLKIGKRT